MVYRLVIHHMKPEKSQLLSTFIDLREIETFLLTKRESFKNFKER